jgi:hypothetical protein
MLCPLSLRGETLERLAEPSVGGFGERQSGCRAAHVVAWGGSEFPRSAQVDPLLRFEMGAPGNKTCGPMP